MKRAVCHSWNFQYPCGANHAFLLLYSSDITTSHQPSPSATVAVSLVSTVTFFAIPNTAKKKKKKEKNILETLLYAFWYKIPSLWTFSLYKDQKGKQGSWHKNLTWHVLSPTLTSPLLRFFLLFLLFCSMIATIFSTLDYLHS